MQPVSPKSPETPGSLQDDIVVKQAKLKKAIEARDRTKTIQLLSQQDVSFDAFVKLCEYLPDIAQQELSKNPQFAERLDSIDIRFLLLNSWEKEPLLLQLVACGMSLHLSDGDDRTPLSIAIDQNLDQLAIAMIDKGADIHAQGSFLQTPLHVAVKEKLHAVIDKLLAHGANIYVKDLYGISPLDAAQDDPELVAKLCKYNLETLINDPANEPRVIAQFKSGARLSEYDLLNACQNYPALMYRVIEQVPEIAKQCSALMLDTLMECPQCEELVLAFLDHGAEIHSHHLTTALRHNFVRVAKKLLDKGVKASETRDCQKMTALHYVAKFGYCDLMHRIAAPHLLFIPNGEGKTPRDLAKAHNHEILAESLLYLEADTAFRNQDRTRINRLIATNREISISRLEGYRSSGQLPFLEKCLVDDLSGVVGHYLETEGQNLHEPEKLLYQAANHGFTGVVKQLLIALTPDALEKSRLEALFAEPEYRKLFVKILASKKIDSSLHFLTLSQTLPHLMSRLLDTYPDFAKACTSAIFEVLIESSPSDTLLEKLRLNSSILTPSHLTAALRHSKLWLARALLDIESISVNHKDTQKMTPLHYAAQLQDQDLIEKLLAKEADPLAENGDKMTPRAVALAHNHLDVAALLYKKELTAAIKAKNRERVKMLLSEKKGDLSQEDFTLLCMHIPDLALDYVTEERAKGLAVETINNLCTSAQYDALLSSLIRLRRTIDKRSTFMIFENGLAQTAQVLLAKYKLTFLKSGQTLLQALGDKPHATLFAKELLQAGVDPFYASKQVASVLNLALNAKNSGLIEQLTEHLPGAMKQELAKGIPTLKTRCQKDVAFVRACCSETTTPLEIAILLCDRALAVSIMRNLTQEVQLQGIGILIARYPKAIGSIVDFFFERDLRYNSKEDLHFIKSTISQIPPQDCRPSVIYEHIRASLRDAHVRAPYIEWAKTHLKRYVPGHDAYKEKKDKFQALQREQLKRILATDAPQKPASSDELEILQNERQDEIRRWLIEKPFAIILTLLELQALKIKTSEIVEEGEK